MSKYHCYSCEYFTYNKQNFDRHLKTKKHSINTNNIISDVSMSTVCQQYVNVLSTVNDDTKINEE